MGFCPRHHKQLRAGITELWNIGVGRELWHHRQGHLEQVRQELIQVGLGDSTSSLSSSKERSSRGGTCCVLFCGHCSSFHPGHPRTHPGTVKILQDFHWKRKKIPFPTAGWQQLELQPVFDISLKSQLLDPWWDVRLCSFHRDSLLKSTFQT